MGIQIDNRYPKLLPASRWIRHKHIQALINYAEQSKNLSTSKIGESEEGRSLHSIYWGNGEKSLLIWTQMHGNEPTASHALDQFIQDLEQNPKLQSLKGKIRIAIIPLLNPDGAERFQRRNALGIDLNRDAVARSSKEMKAFFQFLEDFTPQWAFNMHDQRNIFSVGAQENCATLSFLAASPNENRSISLERKASMQLISKLMSDLEPQLSGHFGRYTDEFYPKALGDNLMKMGIPNVLFEAGHYPGDDLRETASDLIFKALSKSIEVIANDQWQFVDTENYFKIPENKQGLRDLILRGQQFRNCQMDLALMKKEIPNPEGDELDLVYEIVDIGDLSHLKGITEKEGGEIISSSDLSINQLAHFSQDDGRQYNFINGVLQPL